MANFLLPFFAPKRNLYNRLFRKYGHFSFTFNFCPVPPWNIYLEPSVIAPNLQECFEAYKGQQAQMQRTVASRGVAGWLGSYRPLRACGPRRAGGPRASQLRKARATANNYGRAIPLPLDRRPTETVTHFDATQRRRGLPRARVSLSRSSVERRRDGAPVVVRGGARLSKLALFLVVSQQQVQNRVERWWRISDVMVV